MRIFCDSPSPTCPGSDNPVANFSSEEPDKTIYLSIGYGFDIPPGTTFPPVPNCVTFTQSSLSQSDAELCATVSQGECVNGLSVVETSTACTVTPSNPNQPVNPFHPNPPHSNAPVIAAFSGFSCADEDYAFTLSVVGVNLPISISVTDGTFPPGLTLDANGLIHGAPTTPGNYSFTITATDSANLTSTNDMTFVVLGVVTASPLPNGQLGVAYSQQLVGGGGAETFEVTSGSLPDGITMDEFGLVSGTPTTAGDSHFTVTVTDDFFNVCDKKFALTIVSVPINWGLLVWDGIINNCCTFYTPTGTFLNNSWTVAVDGGNGSDLCSDNTANSNGAGQCNGSLTYNGPATTGNVQMFVGGTGSVGMSVKVIQDGNDLVFCINAGMGPFLCPFSVADTLGVPSLLEVEVRWTAQPGSNSSSGFIV